MEISKENNYKPVKIKNRQYKLTASTLRQWELSGLLVLILLLTTIAFLPILKNGFIWDDLDYIVNNQLLRSLSWGKIQAIFLNFKSDNYAPLNDLIHALQYKINGLNPGMFHLWSLIFHLVNIILVFWFIKLLSRRWDVSLVASLLFAIHPMQVESVAWAAARNYPVCSMFFLSSLISYIYYLHKDLNRYYIISLMLFILSLLSKGIGVMLPFILLLIDYKEGRKISYRTVREKFPFFLIAFCLAVLAWYLKDKAGSIGDLAVIPLAERLVFACYGFVTYLIKFFLPLNLSAFYPFPMKNHEVYIPTYYYLYVLCVSGLVFLTVYFRHIPGKIVFGMGFFILNIFLLLQFLPLGKTIIAERYVYLPYVGLCYLAGEGFVFLRDKIRKTFVVFFFSVIPVIFLITTNSRCKIWNNRMSLWNDVLSKYQSEYAYHNRGVGFINLKRYDEAIQDFNKAIELNPRLYNAFIDRGNLFMMEHNYEKALADYDEAIKVNPYNIDAYNNRAVILRNEKKYEEAMKDYTRIIELYPDYSDAFSKRGILYKELKMYDKAFEDYTHAIKLNPGYALAWYNRGILEYQSGNMSAACEDLKKAAGLGYKPAEEALSRICK